MNANTNTKQEVWYCGQCNEPIINGACACSYWMSDDGTWPEAALHIGENKGAATPAAPVLFPVVLVEGVIS